MRWWRQPRRCWLSARVQRDDPRIYSLHQPPGHRSCSWPALRPILKGLQPEVVHTRDLMALDMWVAAGRAGVSPCVQRVAALSDELGRYRIDTVGFRRHVITQSTHRVDTGCSAPAELR